MAPTFVALGVEFSLRSFFRPYVWFLFYPAVFFSSWIGGVRAAVASAAISAAAVLFFFVPPEHSFDKRPGEWAAGGIFFAVGVLFGVFHERLRRANRQSQSALVASSRANEALKKALEERRIFAALVENSSDFIGIADPDGKPVYVNAAGRRMVGLSPDYPIESTAIPEYYPPDQRSFAQDVIVKAMVDEGHWAGETAFRNWQTGEAIPVSDTHFMIRDARTDEVLGMGTITRDISDIKRARDEADDARRQLRKAHEALTSLVEQAPDGIFMARLDGRCTEVNSAACSMLGYAHDELLGKSLADLVPATEAERLSAAKQRLLAGDSDVGEWTLVRKDGRHVPVEISSKILADGRWQLFVRDVTNRKQLEEALRLSHGDLVRAQSVAHVGSWRLDVRHNVLRWSDEAYRIFGVPLGTPMTYEGFLACVHPEDRAYVDREWTAALRGEPYDIEHRVVADGTTKWVREKADLEFDEHHALRGGIGITHDITDRKRQEEALRLAEAKASGIVSTSADAIITIDEAQRITLFNDSAEKIFGFSKEEAIGAPLGLVIPERFRAVHHDHVERFAAGPEGARPVRAGIVGLRKSGEEFPVDVAISKVHVAGRRILTASVRDASERKRLEREQSLLAEMGAAFAATLDYEETLRTVARLAVRDLADFCIVDVVVDGGVERLTVMSRDPAKTWIARLFDEFTPDRSRPHITGAALETRQPVLMEHVWSDTILSLAQSEGHLRALLALDPKSVVSVPLLAHGQLLGALALVSSSNSRVYGPSDVRLAEEIARRAALAIDNAHLYRLATRAIQARDEILGFVAHDLRNPLGSILMQAALLRRPGGEPERRSRAPAETIERAAARMNRLINDLLDVTRAEAGHLALDEGRLSVTEIISDSVQAHRSLASSASIELRSELPRTLPQVWADRDRLLQVLDNLIGNSIKFVEPGGRVTVGATPRDDEVVFWVADTGAGISADDLPHVFDRFWQAERARRAGAGLGLAIVKGIVEAHGGRVWVDSTLGRGSTFFFAIPTARSSQRRPMKSTPRRPSA